MATYYTKWSFTGTNSPNGETYTVDGKKVTYYNDVRYKFVVSEKVNKADNTSTFTVDKYAVFYYTWDNNSHAIDLTMKSKMPQSADYKSESATVSSSTSSSGYKYVGQDSFTISHNTDGSGSTSFSGLGTYVGGSGKTYTTTVSDSYIEMVKINRVSTVTTNATSSAGKLFGDEVTFNISRYNSKFTHKLTYKSGGTTYTIGTDIGTSKTYTFPTSLVSNYPDSIKNGITVTCTSYDGNSKIGTSTCKVYLSVPESYVPTINSFTLEEANSVMLGLGLGVYIKGKSQIKGSISANGSANSTIKTYLTEGNNQTFETPIFTTGFINKSNEAMEFTTTVTDSRGRIATTSKTLNVLEYAPPIITNAKVERYTANGNLSEDGTYGKATIEYNISPIDDLNTKTIKVSFGDIVKEVTPTDYSGTYIFEEMFEGLETNQTYNFTFELIDLFETVPYDFQVSPSFVTMSKKAGGRGVTFGQVAEEDGLVSHMDNKFYKKTWAKEINIDGLKIEKLENGGWVCYVEDEA